MCFGEFTVRVYGEGCVPDNIACASIQFDGNHSRLWHALPDCRSDWTGGRGDRQAGWGCRLPPVPFWNWKS
jgi:hypothetical protein